jgi:hypothetical protein
MFRMATSLVAKAGLGLVRGAATAPLVPRRWLASPTLTAPRLLAPIPALQPLAKALAATECTRRLTSKPLNTTPPERARAERHKEASVDAVAPTQEQVLQLPFRTRKSSDEKDPASWTPLEFLPWRSNMTVMRADTAKLKQSDANLAAQHPPLLWHCDTDGNPLPDGRIAVAPLLLLQWTAATLPRPPELDLLLQRNTSTGAPGAFVLFTLPSVTVTAPVQVSATQPAAPVTSATDPDIAALVAFLRAKYPERTERSCPIKSAGRAFELRAREVAVAALAEHVNARLARYSAGAADDQRFHKVAVAAAGPGTGKTRLLWDALELLQGYFSGAEVPLSHAREVADLVAHGTRLFVTYGNGSSPLNEERMLDTVVGGFAARLLHVHFCADELPWDEFAEFLAKKCFNVALPEMFRQLTLRTALRTIVHDLLAAQPDKPGQPLAGTAASQYTFMVLALDEFTKISTEPLGRLADALKNAMNSPSSLADGRRIFIQPMLGGTAMTAATSALSASGMLALPMAVPPLNMDDVLKILRTPGILPAQQLPLLHDRHFLELVADISGHPRSLDYLVMRVRDLDYAPERKTMSDLYTVLAADLRGLYRLIPDMDRKIMNEAIRVAILGDEVVPSDFADAESRGLVLRMEDKAGATRLHIPSMFLDVWRFMWLTQPMFASVQHLFRRGLQLDLANVDTWQHFEIEVFRMEALRLACTTGTRRPLADLLRGALGNVASVAAWKTTVDVGDRLTALPHRLPFAATAAATYHRLARATDGISSSLLNADDADPIDARRVLLGLSAAGAPFDQFSSRIEDPRHGQGMLCMQSKHTCMLDGDKLTLAQVHAEYDKISEAMRDADLRAHFGCAEPELPFVVLLHTVKPLAPDVTAANLPPRCFVVGRQQFPEYFGTIFGARMEIVARATGATTV